MARGGNPARLRPLMPWEVEFEQYFPVYERARELERAGRTAEALEAYLRILSVYTPRGTVYYERPAIILERLGRFDEVSRICSRAIRVIEGRVFQADPDEFRRRLARLQRKVGPR